MSDSSVLSVQPKIIIYGKEDCVFCTKAKEALDSVDLKYEYKMLNPILGLPDKDGKTPPIDPNWRTNGMVDLWAKWVLCEMPTPFILVEGTGHENLASVLEAVNYRDRKKKIVARKRREKEEADSWSDA